ncbi:hypothetical protein O6P43_001451 [Quillaja saponaria]|uniref:Uncharacterized protein n=1 Tax=Quillaja saponaria TaxID=32244 RepID=A0AAD7QJA5_QUISA|nr:hypothetical protein O6P43_001451 [Quillaja saponaria]
MIATARITRTLHVKLGSDTINTCSGCWCLSIIGKVESKSSEDFSWVLGETYNLGTFSIKAVIFSPLICRIWCFHANFQFYGIFCPVRLVLQEGNIGIPMF